MNEQVISSITDTFRFAKWMKPNDTAAKKGWFLLEINPFPSYEELPLIISDIHYGRDIGVSYSDGHLYHDPTCQADHRLDPELDQLMRRVMRSLKPRTFRIALLPGIYGFVQGQPLAIGIDPRLDYKHFPDHPHINTGAGEYPATLCYTDDIPGLGSTEEERMHEAIRLISIWLFRHMIWQESRRYRTPGIWIGPESPMGIPPAEYPRILDPEGRCRCGKPNKYKNCHLAADLKLQPTSVTVQAPNGPGKVKDPRLVRIAHAHKQESFVTVLLKQRE